MEKQAVVVNVVVPNPYMTLERYAESCGVTVGTVEGWARSGYIKIRKIGKRVMVNNMAESLEAAAASEVAKVVFGGAA
jgi:predicted site-specific integrase-resolvase